MGFNALTTYFLSGVHLCTYRSYLKRALAQLRDEGDEQMHLAALQAQRFFNDFHALAHRLLRSRKIAFPTGMIASMMTASVMAVPVPQVIAVPERPITYEFAMPVTIGQVFGSAGFAANAVKAAPQLTDRQFGLPSVEQIRPRVMKSRVAAVTYYESKPAQTDGDPFTTASGTRVHYGTLATNCYPFGTKIRMPDLFGNTIFTVEDRMNARYGCDIVDVWFPDSPENKKFGKRVAVVEVIDPASLEYSF